MTGFDKATVIVVLVLGIAISVGSFFLKRWWNSIWYYNNNTKEIVCEMVKPEYLKPGVCDD